jgi:hypothetical protein
VRVDHDDVIRIAALGLRDQVVVVAVGIDDRVDVELRVRRLAVVEVPEQLLARVEGDEPDRDRGVDGVAVGIGEGA